MLPIYHFLVVISCYFFPQTETIFDVWPMGWVNVVKRPLLTFFWVSGRCLDICPHELPFLLVVSSFLLPKTGCMKITGFAPICGDSTLVSSNFPWKPILFLAVSISHLAGLPTLPWWLLPGHQVWHCCDWGMLPRKSWVNGWWLDKWFVQINLEWTHTSFPAHSHFVFLRDNLSLAV